MHKISKSRIYKIQIKTWHFQRKLRGVNLGVKNENGKTMIKHLGYAGSSHIRKKGRKFKTHPQVGEFCFIRYWVRRLTAATAWARKHEMPGNQSPQEVGWNIKIHRFAIPSAKFTLLCESTFWITFIIFIHFTKLFIILIFLTGNKSKKGLNDTGLRG